MATTTTQSSGTNGGGASKGRPQVDTKAKRIPLAPTKAEQKRGILARRKVRATGHIVERVDGAKNPEIGQEGGRFAIRRLELKDGQLKPVGKVRRFKTRKEMTAASRKA